MTADEIERRTNLLWALCRLTYAIGVCGALVVLIVAVVSRNVTLLSLVIAALALILSGALAQHFTQRQRIRSGSLTLVAAYGLITAYGAALFGSDVVTIFGFPLVIMLVVALLDVAETIVAALLVTVFSLVLFIAQDVLHIYVPVIQLSREAQGGLNAVIVAVLLPAAVAMLLIPIRSLLYTMRVQNARLQVAMVVQAETEENLREDITLRTQAENALFETESRFHAFMDYNPACAWIIDGEGRLHYMNPAYAHLFGAPENLLNKTTFERFPSELATLYHANDMQVYKTGNVMQSVETFPLLDSTEGYALVARFPLTDSAGVRFVGGIAVDITERRRAEEALHAAESRLRTVINNAPMILIGLDMDGVITLLEGRGLAPLPKSRHKAVGRSIFAFYPKSPGVRRMFERIVRGESAQELIPAGDRIFEVYGLPLFDEHETIVGAIGVALDITERMAAEDRLRESEEQLRQAQKMEAIGRLAGGVAHDFNNLLTAISGYSELLLDEFEPETTQHEYLAEIAKATERAGLLTQQLLAFSRRQVLEPRVIDLNTIVLDTGKMVRRLIGEDIEFSIYPDATNSMVTADSGQITQVILNLVINARDAMPDGGKLIVETANVYLESSPNMTQLGLPPGAYIMLAVSDTGTGMDTATQARIFEPFFTTKEPGRGTGLGLSTVYGIIRQSNGAIWLYSEPGVGTTFKIYLPQVLSDPSQQPTSVPVILPRGTETVLVVEDDDSVRALVQTVLQNGGYRVLVAARATEAITLCRQYGAEIHMLLTDVVLPQMNGREMVESLTALYPQMRVLYMSGYTDRVAVYHTVGAGDTAFIQKPFIPDMLLRKIRTVMDTQK